MRRSSRMMLMMHLARERETRSWWGDGSSGISVTCQGFHRHNISDIYVAFANGGHQVHSIDLVLLALIPSQKMHTKIVLYSSRSFFDTKHRNISDSFCVAFFAVFIFNVSMFHFSIWTEHRFHTVWKKPPCCINRRYWSDDAGPSGNRVSSPTLLLRFLFWHTARLCLSLQKFVSCNNPLTKRKSCWNFNPANDGRHFQSFVLHEIVQSPFSTSSNLKN